MKWFKHENTFNNAKIEMLTDKHGAVAYAVYFRTLELIASEVDESNPDDWGYLPELYTTQYLAKKLQVDEQTLSEIFHTCTELNLWEVVSDRIYCPAILERCDDYTQRLLAQSRKKVGTKSEESPTKNRIDKNRLDKNTNGASPSKKGLSPCTSSELVEISTELGVSLKEVDHTHELIINKIKAGEFKNKTVYYTLRNWLIMGIQRGNISTKGDGYTHV